MISELPPSALPPWELLQLADPDLEKVKAYLPNCLVGILSDLSEPQGVIALQVKSPGCWEIENLAVATEHQGKGHARKLLQWAKEKVVAKEGRALRVATGNSSLPALELYESFGMQVLEIDRGYFLRAYQEPIFENGVQCTHRIILGMEW
ncbi:MAG: GNAT family N-acetyltransferase [Salibacteraceae bacterium]